MVVNTNPRIVLDGILSLAGTAALLKIYTSPMPSAGATPTGTLLTTVTMNNPLGVTAGSDASYTLTISPPDSATAVGTGTAAWARLTDSSGSWIMDLDITLTTANPQGAITMYNTNIYTGGSVTLSSAILTSTA